MEQETLKLSEYLKLCLAFEQDPSDENLAAIREFFSKLQVVEYMPLKDKMVVIAAILSSLPKDSDEIGITSQLEIGRVVRGLLAYCVNLEVDVGILGSLYVTYDYIHIHGLFDHVEKRCHDDYARLGELLNNSLNVTHIERLVSTVSLLSDADYDQWRALLADMKQTLTPELIGSFTQLSANGDQTVRDMIDDISRLAVQDAMRDKAESEAIDDTEGLSVEDEDEFEEETDEIPTDEAPPTEA